MTFSLVGILLHFRIEIVYSWSSRQTKGEHRTTWSCSRNEERWVSISRSNVPNVKSSRVSLRANTIEASKFLEMQKSSEYVRFLSKRIHPTFLQVYCFLVFTANYEVRGKGNYSLSSARDNVIYTAQTQENVWSISWKTLMNLLNLLLRFQELPRSHLQKNLAKYTPSDIVPKPPFELSLSDPFITYLHHANFRYFLYVCIPVVFIAEDKKKANLMLKVE